MPLVRPVVGWLTVENRRFGLAAVLPSESPEITANSSAFEVALEAARKLAKFELVSASVKLLAASNWLAPATPGSIDRPRSTRYETWSVRSSTTANSSPLPVLGRLMVARAGAAAAARVAADTMCLSFKVDSSLSWAVRKG